MTDTTPRKGASVIVHANIPNLTKKMLHKSADMSIEQPFAGLLSKSIQQNP